MALNVLRKCLGNVCSQHRYIFVSSRMLSVKPLTDDSNSAAFNQKNLEETAFVKEIDEATSYNSFLAGLKPQIKTPEALGVLQKLRKYHLKNGIDTEVLLNDKQFLLICNVLANEYEKANPVQLVTGLRCLLELGLSPSMKVVQVFENEVLWMSRKMSVRTLCFCLDYHSRFQGSDQQITVVNSILKHIRNRWLEIENAHEVITILNNKTCFDENFIVKVEDKVLEFADKIPLKDIILLMATFSAHKRRPAPVLRALSYYLVQKQEQLTLRQCVNLCYALTSLNFIDGNILNKVTDDILTSLESNDKRSLVSSLLTSLSLMKWDHSVLLDSCCEWVEKNSEDWSSNDWLSLVLNLARLNYPAEKGKALFSLALKSLRPTKCQEFEPNVWLDCVWALAVLGQATPQHLTTVLEKSFYESIIGDDVPNSIINKLKLQNIDAISKVEFPLAKIPHLDLPNKAETQSSPADQKLRETVVEALKTFVPAPKYLAPNLKTNFGFTITGEFLVDEKGDPVAIADYGVKAGNEKTKALPNNLRRIALLVWGYKDLTLKTNNPTGANSLTVRLLNKIGYTVVEVKYLEFQNLKTTLQQVQYLQQKVKDKIAKA